jgi:cytochrome c peroxidase
VSSAVHNRIPRNSPALFNLGAREFTRMFLDGRVETDPNGYYEGGFVTPAKWKLPTGLENVLAAQAMFPVASPDEMAGQKGENGVANAVSLNNAAGAGGVWETLAKRLQEIPEYVDLFKAAFPDQVESADDITYVLAANAIGAFEAQAFRADDSPFDRYLRGSRESLSDQQLRGLELFYGKAGCAGCHAGKFQTDHEFHAIAMPQIGPGKADGSDADYWRASGERAFLEDFGRGRVTVRPEDEFKFRTPSLRNVTLTGPWGHDGAYFTLEDVVRHHLDPLGSLEVYTCDEDDLPELDAVLELTATGSRLNQSWLNTRRLEAFLMRDSWVQENPELRGKIGDANELTPVALTDTEVQDLLAFLESLTDESSTDLSDVVPERVPSGLPVDK